MHILCHEGKSAIFSEKGKIRLKKGKNGQMHKKNIKIFYDS